MRAENEVSQSDQHSSQERVERNRPHLGFEGNEERESEERGQGYEHKEVGTRQQ
jgi:hypothetical protein